MEKFDVRTAKLVSIIALILFIFIMVINNAYNYLSDSSDNTATTNNEIILPTDEEETISTTEESTEQKEEESTAASKENRDTATESVLPAKNEIPSLETFAENETDQIVNEQENLAETETYEKIINRAKEYKQNKQLAKAIEEYQKALNLASNAKEKAECYEEISIVYAITKKYGTALAYAQRAYNLSPSTSREMLLARLYYKTGATDKASDRVNNVLRRDFSQDY